MTDWPSIHLKRVYEPPAVSDGVRVLVDRLWPRGLKKTDADLDDWWKELAPSAELRKWFGHRHERFAEFQHRYLSELQDNIPTARTLLAKYPHETLTLLYAASDRDCNHAIILRDFLVDLRAS